ncbi:MAG: sugar ABC transporter substrate-binding protein [Chloroflexota bacterium]|nr:sugar ABC transporter substrate-binding protein [Chloroflexota bacterium]
MKRVLLLIVFVALFGALAVSAQDTPVILKFVGWGGPEEGAVFTALTEQFNAANTDVQIVYEQIPVDYVTALTTMIAGGTPPDIAYIPDGDFLSFVSRGQLVNIQEYVDAGGVIDPDDVWMSALGRYRWDDATNSVSAGDLYALPKDIGPTVLYINEDIFEANGVPLPDPTVPMTWDELVEVATQLTVDVNGNHPGEDGFDRENVETFGLGDIWFENAVYNNGGRLVSEDGRTFVAAEDQNTIDAIQFLSDVNHVYEITPTQQQLSSMGTGQMFEAGRIAITTNGRWAVTGYRGTLDFNWSVRPNAVGPSGELTTFMNQDDCTFTGWSGSVGIAVIAGTQGEANADKAVRFIEYLAGAEGQTAQAALGFQIPNQVSIAETDAFLQPDQEPDNAQIYLEAARCELPGPWTQTPLYGQWFDDNFWRGMWIDVVIENTMLAEDAFAERAAAFQSGLDEAWASISN